MLTPTDDVSGRTLGKRTRKAVPRSSHGSWSPEPDRPDPVELIIEQNEARLDFLVPIRHWRMSQSPFAFHRGAAKVMAGDLATTPITGFDAQICGDAHLANFGVYGSPERDLVFDVNDFDETLPGPWEWDLKRLAASFTIAARHNGFDTDDQRDLPRRATQAYREAMSRLAAARYLDAWYAHVDVEDVRRAFSDQIGKRRRARGERFVRTARSKNSLRAFDKLTERHDGGYRIASQPPLLVPLRDIPTSERPDEIADLVRTELEQYLSSVPDHVEVLLRRYRFCDLALKVVGVGSVGTRCLIVLLMGRDESDPFFLQVKEAGPSVLEDHLPASAYPFPGRRVVEGQRLMQAVSDSFLGWNQGGAGHHFYWRQLHDMKGSPEVDGATPAALRRYALLCGATLARAHGRSADVDAIAGYLGTSDTFDRAIADFAIAYADQNERDFAAFVAAIRSGAVVAHE